MKLSKLSILFLFSFSIACYGMSKERLIVNFYAMDTPQAVKEVHALAYQNIHLLRQILETPNETNFARENAFSILLSASRKNLLPQKEFFRFAFDQLANLNKFSRSRNTRTEEKRFVFLLSHYSYVPLLNRGVSLKKNYENTKIMLQLLIEMKVRNWSVYPEALRLVSLSEKELNSGKVAKAISLIEKADSRLHEAQQAKLFPHHQVVSGHVNNLVKQAQITASITTQPPNN